MRACVRACVRASVRESLFVCVLARARVVIDLPEVLVENVLGVFGYLDAHEAVRPLPLEVLALERVAEHASPEVLDDDVASRDDLLRLRAEAALSLEARREGVEDHLPAQTHAAR